MWQSCNVNKAETKNITPDIKLFDAAKAGSLKARADKNYKIAFEKNSVSGPQIVIYLLSLVITFLALYFAVSGGDIIGPASTYIFGVLFLNFGLILYFIIGLIGHFSALLRGTGAAKTGARLHVHYVRIFIFAAALPAVLIAVFSALTIGRGVQAWLSGQVTQMVSATSGFGKETIQQASDAARLDTLAMASDLNAAAAQYSASKEEYRRYFATQTERRGFVGAYLYNGEGQLLETIERPSGTPARMRPEKEDFNTAKSGGVYINIDRGLIVRVLFKLNSFEDIYLQAVRLPKPEQLRLVEQAEQIVTTYQLLKERQAQLQFVFILAYFETVLLVGIGAAWLGLLSASSISVPIARLAEAAENVREGDLSVRVETDSKVDELTALITTFNLMTSDLQSQRADIENSRIQAETRSEFIQALFEGVSAGIVSLDGQNKVLASNGSAARLLGVKSEELLEKGLLQIAPEFANIISSVKRNHVSQGHIEHDLGENHILLDIRAAYAGDDVVVTFDDITSQVAAQRQAAWRDVARRIAHEIKNPLTPIQLSAERLSRKFSGDIKHDKETFNKLTDTIIRQVSDIGRMVDEFSAFARMPAPKFEIDDLGEIVRQAVFAQKITYSDIEYDLFTPPEHVWVSMDGRLISQAIGNILKNAAESIAQVEIKDDEKINHKIEITLDFQDNMAIIEISDTGIGFPKQDRNRLLEPYITTRSKGTGLGLAIVARVLEEHGGALKLYDRKDDIRGARVLISLPLSETSPQSTQIAAKE